MKTTDFTHSFTLVCFGDLEADADYTADEDDNILLNSVHLGGTYDPQTQKWSGGRDVSAAWISDVVGEVEYERQLEAVETWWADEGSAEYARNDADDYGDYLYERARDDRMDAA